MDKEPAAHGACTVAWPEEDESEAAVKQQQHAMAAFLGKSKKAKIPDRHRWLHDAHLEPVDAW